MTGYPSPKRWREFASMANKLADQCAAEGNHKEALRHRERAEFYEYHGDLEEWWIAHPINIKQSVSKVLEAMS